MLEKQDQIQDITAEVEKKTGHFQMLRVVFAALTLLIAAESLQNIFRIRHVPFLVYALSVVISSIPLTLMILFSQKKKLGWISSVLFYNFLTLFLLMGKAKRLFLEQKIRIPPVLQYRTMLLIGLSMFATLLLISKTDRNQFEIEENTLVWTLVLSTISGITLGFMAV